MSQKGRKIFWPLLAVGALMAVFAFARARAGDDLLAAQPEGQLVYSLPRGSTTSSIMSNSAQNPQARVEVEEVTMRQHGFEPAEITRPIGRFILVVANPGGTRNLSLRLDTEIGARLREIQLRREQPAWSDSILLPPGRYLLTEANHPDRVCRINIR